MKRDAGSSHVSEAPNRIARDAGDSHQLHAEVRMKFFVKSAMVCGVLAGLFAVGSDSAVARPKYKGVFEKTYEKVAKDNKVTCNACHDGDDKKKRNNYGEALGKNTGKNEMDEAKIKEALTKTESEKSAIKDKTFGDLLKDGKLPASK